MLLILNRTSTDCDIWEKILNIAPVLRVKHLICTGESALCDGTDVHFSHGDKSLNHVRSLLRVRLWGDALVALTGCSWLICIYTWDDNYAVLYILLNLCQAADVVTDWILVISWTRSDNDKKSIIISTDNIWNHCIALRFKLGKLLWQRIFLLNLCRSWKLV